MPYQKETKNINGKGFSKIDVWFLVFVIESYMISLVSYKDGITQSSRDSLKLYMILIWKQRKFNHGHNVIQKQSSLSIAVQLQLIALKKR